MEVDIDHKDSLSSQSSVTAPKTQNHKDSNDTSIYCPQNHKASPFSQPGVRRPSLPLSFTNRAFKTQNNRASKTQNHSKFFYPPAPPRTQNATDYLAKPPGYPRHLRDDPSVIEFLTTSSLPPMYSPVEKETLFICGLMRGHTDAVTSIACRSDTIITSSRDKSLILWKLNKDFCSSSDVCFGVPHRRLTGHDHPVLDVALSSDGHFALSGSSYGELRLWDLDTGTTARMFVGHTDSVLSVAFSLDDSQIVSASRDKTIKLWNTLGECNYTFQGHHELVTSVSFLPDKLPLTIVSGSLDKTVKIWDLSNCKPRASLEGHTGSVLTVAVSPDGSMCASGGSDGNIFLWDFDGGKELYSLESGSTIQALCFSPNRSWLCAATHASIDVWDLKTKSVVVKLEVDLKCESLIFDYESDPPKTKVYCTSLCWSADGSTLFSGHTDGVVRVWEVRCLLVHVPNCET